MSEFVWVDGKHPLQDIVDRKAEGIDCTEEESCTLMRYFERYPTDNHDHRVLRILFPLEYDQWMEQNDR
jgi:hypothetical protein